jgi:hypothetical protein
MASVTSRTKAGLTADDLESLASALAAGKRVTVYLRDPMPSLELPAGASARVMSVDGSTVTVSPKGVDDQLPFEANELQKTRTAAKSTTPARQRPVKRTSAPLGVTKSARSAATVSTPEPEPAKSRPQEQKAAPPQTPRRSKTSTTLSVTITSVGEGGWTVSVSHGSKRLGKPTEVTSDQVTRAMHMLGDHAAIMAVDAVIESARAAAQKRVDALSNELEAARAVLAHLDCRAADS